MATRNEQILALHALGWTRLAVANELHLTRNAVIGVVDRHNHPERKHTKSHIPHHTWSVAALTERWVDYTARKKAERAAQRAAADSQTPAYG